MTTKCIFVDGRGKSCNNSKINFSNYCHIQSHYPTKDEYQFKVNQNIELFRSERIPIKNFEFLEVSADGACLFRCLSIWLFYSSKQDLQDVKRKFLATEYFREDITLFLSDYDDIADCLTDPDYILDDDVEGDIARGVQQVIVNFIRANPKINIAPIINPENKETITLEDLIQICHDMDFQNYILLYQRFAGDDDFIMTDVEDGSGNIKQKKFELNDRWGGIPELVVFAILFKANITIYVPQKFDKVSLKPVNVGKISKNKDDVYLKQIDKISCPQKTLDEFNILLRNHEKGSHYDFLKMKN